MKMIAARCSGMLALALLALAVSANADSIYADAVPSGLAVEGWDLSLPTVAPRSQYSGDRHRAVRCCVPTIRPSLSFFEDFSWTSNGLSAQSGHRELVISPNPSVSLMKSASLRSSPWDNTDAIDEGALANEFGNDFRNVGANFALSADSASPNGGYGNFASPWVGMPGNGGLFEDAAGGAEPQTSNVDGNVDGDGKTIQPVGAKRGNGGPPVTRNAPLVEVSEPSMLALFVAGLTALGLLMWKRTA